MNTSLFVILMVISTVFTQGMEKKCPVGSSACIEADNVIVPVACINSLPSIGQDGKPFCDQNLDLSHLKCTLFSGESYSKGNNYKYSCKQCNKGYIMTILQDSVGHQTIFCKKSRHAEGIVVGVELKLEGGDEKYMYVCEDGYPSYDLNRCILRNSLSYLADNSTKLANDGQIPDPLMKECLWGMRLPNIPKMILCSRCIDGWIGVLPKEVKGTSDNGLKQGVVFKMCVPKPEGQKYDGCLVMGEANKKCATCDYDRGYYAKNVDGDCAKM